MKIREGTPRPAAARTSTLTSRLAQPKPLRQQPQMPARILALRPVDGSDSDFFLDIEYRSLVYQAIRVHRKENGFLVLSFPSVIATRGREQVEEPVVWFADRRTRQEFTGATLRAMSEYQASSAVGRNRVTTARHITNT